MKKPSSRKEAVAMGLRWYISIPCPRGHLAKRNVSNGECRFCVNEKRTARRRTDPQWAKQQDKARYWKDPEKSRAKGNAFRNKHLEQRRLDDRTRYANNPEPSKARATAWNRSHPENFRHHVAMRRARLAQATPAWLTREQRAEIRSIYAKAVALGPGFEVDHIIPLRGRSVCGLHVPWNLRVIPKRDNRKKSNRYDD